MRLNDEIYLGKSFVSCGFENYQYLKPTLEEIISFEKEMIEEKLEENIWGCHDIEFCGNHFMLYCTTFNEKDDVVYTYIDNVGRTKLNVVQNQIVSVENKQYFSDFFDIYSISEINKFDYKYNGHFIYNEQPKKWKDKDALTDNEETFLKLINSLLDNDFTIIFEKISEYRLQQYNLGIIEDIKFPFKKLKYDALKNKRKQFFQKIKDNYESFPYFKKYCDIVFFYLDNENI